MTDAPISGLQKQLEKIRLDRALEVAESIAQHRALLTTAELARINNILTGKNVEPWRRTTTTIRLPSGKMENVSLIVDPVLATREKLHRATEMAERGQVIDAAVEIYSTMVLSHIFEDGNRRTAVAAAAYFLKRYGAAIS